MTEFISQNETPEQIAEWEEWNSQTYEREYAAIQELRRQAYVKDADPLFFGFQRGKNTKEEWLEAIKIIEETYPYPNKQVSE